MTWLMLLAFGAVAMAELLRPETPISATTARRWFGNIGIFSVGIVLMWLPPLAMAIGAIAAWPQRFGLLPLLPMPSWLAVAVGLLLLDAASYAVHRLSHLIGPLWRLHAVHHSDPELDVTTQVRHHPLELLVATPLLGAATALLGVPPDAVGIYVVLETLVQSLAHANLALPAWVARLEALLVTPDFHRLHHSGVRAETDSNYGQVLSVWDRLFGTFRPHVAGHRVTLGLDGFRDARVQGPHWLLAQPLRHAAPARTAAAESRHASASAIAPARLPAGTQAAASAASPRISR